MKRTLFLALLLSLAAVGHAQYVPSAENLAARQAFADAKFGIFLHWGLYSVYGQGEWYMNVGIDNQEYAKAANAFYPHDFDADEWVKIFRESGAKYICFTSRHHEGFSMWDTKASDYNIMHTPYGKDVVGQLADACHKADMPLHLYYSHLDWTREDYPLGRTGLKTGRKHASKQGDWNSYYAFMNAQLRELLTNYGRIGAIWFDGWWDHDEDAVPFDWHLPEQYALIHSLQPACLIGNNHHQTPFEGEDIQIFERDVPGENKAGLSGQDISRLPLETCQTMNGMWGYKVIDQNYKSTAELIQLLVRTSGKGANLLLNIGPQPDGRLPQTAVDRLREIGQWLRTNGESIYATTAGEVGDGTDIVSTRKGSRLYVHVLSPSRTPIAFKLPKKPQRVCEFPSGRALPFNYADGIATLAPEIPENTIDYIFYVE